MTVGNKTLVACVNQNIVNVDINSPLEILQLISTVKDFTIGFEKTVANCVALPPAADNKGRLIYLEDCCSYQWSDGQAWYQDIPPTPVSLTAWSWGFNGYGIGSGQLGDNSAPNTRRSSPVSVVGGFTDWCQVSTGYGHGLGVRQNGTVWAWGYNSLGQLGNNSTSDRSSPVSVAGGFTDWCQVSGGDKHSLGLRANGTVWAWGYNFQGRLGDNSTVDRSSPVSVVGGFTDWCQVSAGTSHNVGLRSNGTLWSWGNNDFFYLGASFGLGHQSSPVSVIGGFTDWCRVSAGAEHTLAVRTNGTAWAWGLAGLGQLGDGTTIDRSSPVSVVGVFHRWRDISAGVAHSVGIRTDGTAWSWGYNSSNYGRLGDNTVIDRSSPVSVVGGFTNWCQVSAGSNHTLGVRTNGTVWGWGNNGGELGDGAEINRSSPVSVVGGFTNWCQVSASRNQISFSLGIKGI